MREKTLAEGFDVPHVQRTLQHSIRSLMIHGEDPVPLQRVLALVNNIVSSMNAGTIDFAQTDFLIGLTSITVFIDPRYQSNIARQYLEGHRDVVRLYETRPPVEEDQQSCFTSWFRCFLNIFYQVEVYPEMIDQYRIIPHGQHLEDASHNYYG